MCRTVSISGALISPEQRETFWSGRVAEPRDVPPQRIADPAFAALVCPAWPCRWPAAGQLDKPFKTPLHGHACDIGWWQVRLPATCYASQDDAHLMREGPVRLSPLDLAATPPLHQRTSGELATEGNWTDRP